MSIYILCPVYHIHCTSLSTICMSLSTICMTLSFNTILCINQLHYIHLQVVNSEANISIIVESIVNETNRLCQCELRAEQIQDARLMCSNDSNAVTFRASLVGSEANPSAAFVDEIEVWVMNPSSSITIQGRRLSLNPNCEIHLASFSDESCTTSISTPGQPTNVATIAVPIVIVVLLIFIYLLVMILIFAIRRERHRKEKKIIYE